MNAIHFHHPEILSLLLVFPFLVYRYWQDKRREQATGFLLPTLEAALAGGRSVEPAMILFFLRLGTLLLLTIALARPVQRRQMAEPWPEKQVAIVLAVDVSNSMLAEDLKPNRLVALKTIAADFIDQRPKDLIGLTIYAGDSFTPCPLTTDHALLKSLLADASAEWLAEGTAIGMGLAAAVNRLKASRAEAKVIVLLTDGENNAGAIAPRQAADLAQGYNIKVYTIGLGTTGTAPFPTLDPNGQKRYQQVPVSLDEVLLKDIAHRTEGRYFRAKNNADLTAIYQEIDALETTKPRVRHYLAWVEWYLPFALTALGLLVTELMLQYTLLRSFT